MSDDPASKDGLRWEIRQRLVERLRIPWDGMGDMANQQRAEAAVQINTMMDEIEAWRQAMRKAERDMAELRTERDEARMELCERDAAERTKSAWSSGLSMRYLWQDIARERGWDCFKEKP